jgi:hypothetical protein
MDEHGGLSCTRLVERCCSFCKPKESLTPTLTLTPGGRELCFFCVAGRCLCLGLIVVVVVGEHGEHCEGNAPLLES